MSLAIDQLPLTAPGEQAVDLAGSRPSSSVVVLAWNAWQHTRSCLASVQATMSERDELVVVDNGSSDDTPMGLRQLALDKLIVNEENRGFPAGANQGAAVAEGDVVVFLNSDTVVTTGWLDALLAPFTDAAVVATGPRSNYVAGPQIVYPIPYAQPEGALFQEFAARWMRVYAGRCRRVANLIGFCLAVRRACFEQIGGFDEVFGLGNFEDADLCRRLGETGGQLLIVDGAYVHHTGHASFTANRVDYASLMVENNGRYEAKWGPG
ncbi:MAG TPA: glycosyltransferase family 2 protein [Acidimicrobiales bacterium]|nr:glycosyltransferase family 2 protein [Acidimicrobiales bacterium]